MNLEQEIRARTQGKKYPTLTRIKVGKALAVYASLPLFSAWAYLIAIPMMIPLKPSLWAKDKIRYFNEWRSLQ